MHYSLQKEGHIQLSNHFKVYEFASTSPDPYHPRETYTDDIEINLELIEKLEKLIDVLGATRAIISSGYRTSKHDLAVGGNGRGEHTKGNAVDICFYRGSNIIRTDIISMIAQNLGFKGIARINNRYIHLDMRENGLYYGDETKGNSHVTNDFYAYYGGYTNW